MEEGVPTRDEAHKVTTHIIIAVSSQTHQRWLEVWNDYDGTDDDERMTNMINALAQPPRVCLSCGSLTSNGSRCISCHTRHETRRTSKRIRPHYNSEYKRRAKVVRDSAIICWICGEGAKAADPWTADHLVPADPNTVLLPAHRSCNSRRGNRPDDPHTHPTNQRPS